MAAAQVDQLTANCTEFGIPLHGIGDPDQGIVHVIGPQLGLTQPGMTIVCGDSHTSTHGAFGALAFGIGTSEVEMVLASQCVLQRRPKTYEVRVDGHLAPGVSSKDIILALISRIGVGGGTGHVFEYTGEAIRALTMEQRMTVCNMSIEGGARAGLIAPDDVTFEYIDGRRHAPQGAAWDRAVETWRRLRTDEGATYDRSITIDATTLEPMVPHATNPGMGRPVSTRSARAIGTSRAARARAAGRCWHRRSQRPRRRSPESSQTRGRSLVSRRRPGSVAADGRTVPDVHERRHPAAGRERRYRPDRARALPKGHRQGRSRRRPLP